MATNGSKLVLAVVNGVQIPVASADISEGLSTIALGNADSVFPSNAFISQRRPVVTFTSNAIASALAAVPLYGLDLDSTSTVDLYFADARSTGTGTGNRLFYDAVGALRIRVNSGMVFPTAISAQSGSAATATFQVWPSGDDGSTGLVITPDTTCPALSAAVLSESFVVGPFQDSLAAEIPISSWDYSANITEFYLDRAGLIEAYDVKVSAFEPMFSISSNDMALWEEFLSNNSVSGCISDCKLFLRKTSLCAGRVAEATAEHISFLIDSALVTSTNASGAYQSAATYGIEIKPILDSASTNFIVTVDTADAITVA